MNLTLGATALFPGLIALVVLGAFIIFATIVAFAARYKKCPSDRIMVIYGKTSGKMAAQ